MAKPYQIYQERERYATTLTVASMLRESESQGGLPCLEFGAIKPWPVFTPGLFSVQPNDLQTQHLRLPSTLPASVNTKLKGCSLVGGWERKKLWAEPGRRDHPSPALVSGISSSCLIDFASLLLSKLCLVYRRACRSLLRVSIKPVFSFGPQWTPLSSPGYLFFQLTASHFNLVCTMGL